MKLLSAKEVILKKKSQEEVEMFEAYKAKKRLIKEADQLKKFREGVSVEQKKIVDDHFNEIQRLEKKKSELFKEIESLEKERRMALEPIDEIRMEVMAREENILLAEKKFYKERHTFNEKVEKFNQKVEFLSEKEDEIGKRDILSALNFKKSEEKFQNIKEQEKEHKKIGEKLARYDINLQKKEQELEDRERTVQAKLSAVAEKEKEAERKLKIIASKQASLAAAYNEFKLKTYDSNNKRS